MNTRATQAAVGAGVVALGALYAFGARSIPGEAGYGGVGPNFLPWVVGAALLGCGAWLLFEALSGGFRRIEEASGAASADWTGFVWVSAGILLDALLIEKIGFILACTLCYMVAVRGLRWSRGVRDMSPRSWLIDAAVGAAISAPVFWMFTKALAINLPGLTGTGWL